jgi:hypothetical protein
MIRWLRAGQVWWPRLRWRGLLWRRWYTHHPSNPISPTNLLLTLPNRTFTTQATEAATCSHMVIMARVTTISTNPIPFYD